MGEYTPADIITFIGVPLAVLGVMPLLWNMAKAFIIRRHLVKALPSSIRPYFSIIMDPAAGTVSLTYPSLFLNSRSLLLCEPTEELPPGEWEEMRGEETGDSCLLKQRLLTLERLFALARGIGFRYEGPAPAASWMGLLSVGVKPNQDNGAVRVRVTVESDLNCPPALLACKWPIFVSLAMCMGFYPFDERGRCHDSVDKLRDALRHQTRIATPLALRNAEGEVLLHVLPTTVGNVAKLQKDMFQYSLPRMLAWHNIMVRLDGELTCVALPSLEAFSVLDIVSFSTEGIVRWRQSVSGAKTLSAQPYEPYRLDVHTKDWRPDTFEHCLTWALHAEAYYWFESTVLPTSQTFLIWQEMSVVWLGRRERTALYAQLAELITDPDLLLHTKKYLEECWNTPIFSHGAVASPNSPYQGLLDITPLTDPGTFRGRLREKPGSSYAGARRSATRLGSKYNGDYCKTRPRVLLRLKSHDVGRTIRARYSPILALRTRTDDVLLPGSLEELAAHLIIATAIFKAWPRADWFLHWTDVDIDGRVHYRTYNDDPMTAVLKGESSSEDLATMGLMYLS